MALVLDSSTSIVYETYDNWFREMLGFAQDMTTAFGVANNGTRWSVVTFSDSAQVEIYLNDYYDLNQLNTRIQNLALRGGETNLADAIRITRTLVFDDRRGDRPEVPNIMIMVTDGRANM